MVNEFELCKKNEIVGDKIRMELAVHSVIMTDHDDDSIDSDDDDVEYFNMMDLCVSLTYTLEIGEFHERDKFQWTEVTGGANGTLDGIKKIQTFDFAFKMNHIK